MEENRRWLIRKGLYELEIHDLCFLYNKYDLEDWDWEHRESEDLIVKMYDYISAKIRAFSARQINNKMDGQLIFGNNSSYLLVDAPTIKEALDVFWAKHKEYCEKVKEEGSVDD